MNPTNITLYGIPNCDSVKKARTWFAENNIAYVFHDFKKQGLAPQTLDMWLQHVSWEVLLNRKGTTWRKLDPTTQASVVDAASARAVMLAHLSVIKRPVVVSAQSVSVGVSPQAWAQRVA